MFPEEGERRLRWAQWDRVDAKFEGRPKAALSAHLAWLEAYIAGPAFRGCPFINTTAEFRDPAHPGRRICRDNKAELHRRLGALSDALPGGGTSGLADQLLLLIDGAFASSQVLGKDGPARRLKAAGEAMIAAALAGEPS